MLFLFFSFLLYARPLHKAHEYPTIFAFILMLVISVAAMALFSGGGSFLVALIFSLIFYLLLGIKEHLIVNRGKIYYMTILGILYVCYLFFFASDKSNWFLLKYLAIIVAIFLLFREWLVLATNFNFPKRQLLVACAVALIIGQMLWATALLPIGILSASNILMLFTFISGDFIFKHFIGGISRKFIIQQSIIFLTFAALIFFTSNWTLVS